MAREIYHYVFSEKYRLTSCLYLGTVLRSVLKTMYSEALSSPQKANALSSTDSISSELEY